MREKRLWGFGDVKFMGAIGLYYGVSTIAQIAILSFFVGAIISIILLIVRVFILKSDDQYMPFGPFLVIGAISCIFLPTNTVFLVFIALCSWISDKIISILN